MPGSATDNAAKVRFDERGLVPCVVQDARTGEVLTLAYMNEESLRLTLETRETHFYSRSREEIWHKGETSGNTQRVEQIRFDCDADALVALVEPAGPACHTGERSCFYRDLEGDADAAPDAPASGEVEPVSGEALAALERTLAARAADRPEGSYTVSLLDDPALAGAKVTEEAAEVVQAAESESDERVAEEGADVVYHLAVLLLSRGRPAVRRDGRAERAAREVSAAAGTVALEPSLERARELASDFNVVPVRHTFVDDIETPVSAFLKLRGEGPSFLLESAEQGRLGRWSFLGFRPRSILRWNEGVLSEWEGGADPGGDPTTTSDVSDPYGAVADYLGRYRIAEPESLPPFAGGAVGIFGYDLVRTVETTLGEPNPDPLGLPDLALMISDVLVAFDHQRHEVTLIVNAFTEDEGGIEAAYARAEETIAWMKEKLREPVPRVGAADRQRELSTGSRT